MPQPAIVRSSLLTSLLLLPACPLPILVGDNPIDPSTGEDPSSTDATGDTDAPTTTSTAPAVCGDGVVDDGEPCDDGDDDPDDGCDAACARTGAVAWTFLPTGQFGASDVAVAANGDIILVGPGHVFALSGDGELLWDRPTPGPAGEARVTLDAAGRIYVGTGVGRLHGLDPAGQLLWTRDDGLEGDAVNGLAVRGTTLYTLTTMANVPSGSQVVLRTHDVATGDIQSEATSPAGITTLATGLAVAGTHVLAVGIGDTQSEGPLATHPMIAVYDLAGAEVSFELGDTIGLGWQAIAAAGDGGFILAGSGTGKILLRRLGADLQLLWEHEDTFFGSWPTDIAVGPQGGSVVAGYGQQTSQSGFVRRLDAAGEPLWTSSFPSQPMGPSVAYALAFGPDFVVGLGDTDGVNWVRRFASE